jgi:rubrerythrin
MTLLTGNEIIEIAVNLEESGEAFYTAAADKAVDGAIEALFRELAAQERLHRRTFQGMIAPADHAVEFVLSPEQWDEFQVYTDALLRQSFFASPENALNRAAEAGDAQEALRAAIRFEKESLLFFYELRDVVRGADREAVSRIIQEERRHIQRLTELLL